MFTEGEIAGVDAGLPENIARFGDYFAKRAKRQAAEKAIAEAEKAAAEAAEKEASKNFKKEMGAIVGNIFASFGGKEAFEEDARRMDEELKAALPEDLRRRHEEISKGLNELFAAGKNRSDDPELSKAYVALVQDPVYLQIYEQVYRVPSLSRDREATRRRQSFRLVVS